MTKYSLGICIGASTISFVKAKDVDNEIRVISRVSILHEGNPKKILTEYFNNNNLPEYSVVFTGRKFKHFINGYVVSEPEAIEQALEFLNLNNG